MEIKEIIKEKLQENFKEVKFDFSEYKDEFVIKFDKQFILPVCKFLKTNSELEFIMCEDVTAVDWATRKNRFTVVYHIYSIQNNYRIVLKADVDESDCSIDTVSSVWRSANWQERETYDMYGIIFNNHPDLRRIYMPEEFEYHPLRKDFPLMGIPGSLSLPKK
ncbi:MAG: NADH-quinone oxidoreductase subunit C [Ignavibacteriaceae bacterium]|nr:NADH-quinone oxidoreductase subunit C [Ignavibacteriaceae bacterium]